MPVLALLVILTISCIPLEQDRHVYSQPSKTISTEMVGVKVVQGVDLANIHTSPSNVKVPSKFETTSTVVNNSPSTIMFNAGVCDSPLSVKFIKNVVVKYTQGCTYIFSLIQIETRRTSFNSWSEFRNNISSICSWTNNSKCDSSLPNREWNDHYRYKTIYIHNKFLVANMSIVLFS